VAITFCATLVNTSFDIDGRADGCSLSATTGCCSFDRRLLLASCIISSDAPHTYNRRVPPSANPLPNQLPPERILALDVGNRRIGVAISDELGITAQPLPTLSRRSQRVDIETIAAIAKQHDVRQIVVGLPVRMGGEDSAQTKRTREFAEELRIALSLPVHLADERLTSWEANQMLDSEKLTRIERKGKVDKIAAVLILESYLQQKAGPTLLPPDEADEM
jgi:putative holliday junction resolvase